MKKEMWSWVRSVLFVLACLAGVGAVLIPLVLLCNRHPAIVLILLVAAAGAPLVKLVHDCLEDFVPKRWRKKK